jgi:hypothetical protein
LLSGAKSPPQDRSPNLPLLNTRILLNLIQDFESVGPFSKGLTEDILVNNPFAKGSTPWPFLLGLYNHPFPPTKQIGNVKVHLGFAS